MQITTNHKTFETESLNNIWSRMKEFFNTDTIPHERKEYLSSLIAQKGYLPYTQVQALEELSDAEVIFAVEEKLKKNSTYNGSEFIFSAQSALERRGVQNSAWIKTEQHNIKLVGLAALGNGNRSETPGKFMDWLRELLILPSGDDKNNVMPATLYLLPFHPREFGCAYLPASSEVSPALEDARLKDLTGLDAKGQVKLFIALTQLCGHPVMYDILPQTARFSKIILSHPFAARWFDVKQLMSNIEAEIDVLSDNYDAKAFLKDKLKGKYYDANESIQDIISEIEEQLLPKKKELSENMMKKESQQILSQRAKKIINDHLGFDEFAQISEEDIPTDKQGEIIGKLINEGLWPAPGGAWCSSGVPVFDIMSKGAGYPTFKHFDYEGNDVSAFANLDCQTPYYFVYLEDGSINEAVVEFFVDYMKKLQIEYNFDAYRVDHIDHIVDKFSEDENGLPISYRAPRMVLGKLNASMKEQVCYFGTLAEYMLWDGYLKEYHQDMNFDLLWGNDIVSQMAKTVPAIVEDNETLEKYNSLLPSDRSRLSILKAYNNQDGEFREIDQYPGQLGEAGALFKWLKFKFLPGGKLAQRPVLFIDGDESFNKTGIEKVIGAEISMKRDDNRDFFSKFTAINDFAKSNSITRYGKAEILVSDEDKFTVWIVKEDNNNSSLLVAANAQAPTEKICKEMEDGSTQKVVEKGVDIYNKTLQLPEGMNIVGRYEFRGFELEETQCEGNSLSFEKLAPGEFYIYRVSK